MMIVSYKQGQKYYPINYPVKKLIAYVVVCLVMVGLHQIIRSFQINILLIHAIGLAELIGFMYLVYKVEAKEFKRIFSKG
jgi:heme A synthase